MSERERRIESLFHAARAIANADERRAFLARETGSDVELRARVERLLSADADASASFLAPRADVAAAGEQAGDTIGRYRLLQEIGTGGMGTVWMAEQREPVVRKVALKIIKLGMDTREVVVRFEAERQALALMDHPHIAKVLDGGATASGRPYFVMELVRGVPITDYCDKARLGLRERLELFTKVCEAIQHAHHKGIIHRDVKPSNVLVTLHDGVAVPKVIDFGIAKATSAELTKKTMFTQYAQILGTPEYMAPEQAEMSGLDVDTRADVYSLGVLLYELLTGTKPFDVKTALAAGFEELLRTIREVDPAKPSTRVSTLGERASPIALNRQINVSSWSQRLRGDLDWIVMKALEKDRNRRYETPNGFAEDVARFLREEPVVAAPPSAAYRVRKFVRRRRRLVAGVALVLVLLVLGVVGTTLGLVEARRAAAAERTAKEEADHRRAEAEKNLAFATKTNEILGSIFTRVDPSREYVTLADLRTDLRDGLGDAVEALDAASIGDPLAVADVQMRLGVSLRALGDEERSAAILERARKTFETELGPEDERTMEAANGLATCLSSSGKHAQARKILEEVLEVRRKRLGESAPTTLVTQINLAETIFHLGRTDDAAEMLRDALQRCESTLGPDDRTTAMCAASLANVMLRKNDSQEALPLLERAWNSLRASQGEEAPDTLSVASNLATAYQRENRGEQALSLLETSLKAARSRLGTDHPTTLGMANNLATAYREQDRIADAIPLFEDVWKAQIRRYGPDHPNSLSASLNLSAVYMENGRMDDALPMIEENVRLYRAKYGADHPQTLLARNNLGTAYWRAKRLDQSIPIFEDVLKQQEAKLGPDNATTLSTASNLGVNYRDAGRTEEALVLLQRACAAAKRVPSLKASRLDLLDVLCRLGRAEESIQLEQELLAEARAATKPESSQLAGKLSQIAGALASGGANARAEAVLRENLAIRTKLKPQSWGTFSVMSKLGEVLTRQQKYDEAGPLLRRAYEGLKAQLAEIPVASKSRVPEAVDRLVNFYEAVGNAAEVEIWKKERALYPSK